ncbi:hypothetical protein B296_00025866 [Ensete ventricosum]|uniref:Uncharacterized protein n=1 Tax=Ensete ventricosum TaxID=4639 RepID=A0A426XAL6_ENSVE|nr:hypothetical protein B296_00025866 [Ensete ventricosum]
MAVFIVEGAARVFPKRFRCFLGKSKRRCPYNSPVDDGDGSLLILLLSKPSDLTPLGRFILFFLLTDQVEMASTLSFSVSSFSSSRSSPIPPPQEERHRSNDSSESSSVPESSSSGVMTRAEAKVLQALEVMKSLHDFDSNICLESLGSVRKRFSIPNEYVLHAPRSGQRPYHPCLTGFSISIDALEARLRCQGWNFGVEWSAYPISNVLPNLSDEEANTIERLKGIMSASRAVRNLTEEWLVKAGLSPASRDMPCLC